MRRTNDAADRRKIADQVEIELVIERHVGSVAGPDHEQRIAVRGRLGGCLGADIGTAAGTVLDDELLAHALRQPLPDHACGYVGAAASRKRHDDAYRPRRIGLGSYDTRECRKRSSAGGEMQEFSARKFHRCPPKSYAG